MPYIDSKLRIKVDLAIDEIIRQDVTPDGQLNYLLFSLCKRTIQPSYKNFKRYIGELEECVAEIRRRLLAPYEDDRMAEHGDIN